MKKALIGWLAFVLVVCFVSMSYSQEEDVLVLANFEGWPANTGGNMGVYGSLEPNWAEKATVPYSWVYETATPGYSTENVHSGKQSFRLVTALGSKPDESWGSFAMDMGPLLDVTTMPITVENMDVSKYKYLIFWLKGENGGEHVEVLFRDANALNYMPQVKHKVNDATTKWEKIVVPLDEIKNRVDLTKLANVGIAFGPDVGNMKGATIYMDDFAITNEK